MARVDGEMTESQLVSMPKIVLNVGTGTSLAKITDEGIQRLTGSPIGGGMYMGLMKAMLGDHSFDEALALAASGDNKNVDLTVGDIFADNSPFEGLDAVCCTP